jgi:hypothetical protein
MHATEIKSITQVTTGMHQRLQGRRPQWCIKSNHQESAHTFYVYLVSTNCDWTQFAEETYQLEVSGANLYQLNRAISSGASAGIFTLPKGPSGKVKLAPKKKSASDDEVCDHCTPDDVALTYI